jgi:hypothetical protein
VGIAVASQVLACGESSSSRDAGNSATGGTSNGGTAGGSSTTGGAGASGGTLTTGGASASGGSLATGGAGASGGSFATGGRGGSGGTMMAAGNAGASAGSPAGGTGGKSNYGNPLPVDPRCDAFAARVAEACPGEWTFNTAHFYCQEGFNELQPMGCGSEFGALIECEGEIDCDAGFSLSCPATHGECGNAFVMETQCVREGGGRTCPEGTYAFICRSEPPAPCTVTEGLGSASRACCPPFPDER